MTIAMISYAALYCIPSNSFALVQLKSLYFNKQDMNDEQARQFRGTKRC